MRLCLCLYEDSRRLKLDTRYSANYAALLHPLITILSVAQLQPPAVMLLYEWGKPFSYVEHKPVLSESGERMCQVL